MPNGQDNMYDIDFPRVYAFIADSAHPLRCTRLSELTPAQKRELAILLIEEREDMLSDVLADCESILRVFIRNNSFDYCNQLQKKFVHQILACEEEMLEEMFEIALQQYGEDESERLKEEAEYDHFAHITYILEGMRL